MADGIHDACTAVDLGAIWDEAELCKAEAERVGHGAWDDAASDCDTKEAPILVHLPCGDIHLCSATLDCPYLVANEDRMLVCKYSGIVCGLEHAEEVYDLNGGRGRTSGDPDQAVGSNTQSSRIKRCSAVAASRAAFSVAQMMSESDTDMTRYYAERDARMAASLRPAACRRTARCVNDILPSAAACRPEKTPVCASVRLLKAEAQSIMSKLMNYDRTPTFQRTSVKARGRRRTPACAGSAEDCFVAEVKYYVQQCMERMVQPSMSTIHDIAVSSRSGRARASTLQIAKVHSVRFRSLCTALIVALWQTACTTPYMKQQKRGCTAFRPFVCGCIYAFKRGVQLSSGEMLVPVSDELASTLPVLRGTGGNTVAKALHSSAHRGLCMLLKSVASVCKSQQPDVFAVNARIAADFATQVFTTDDV